jgi:RNA polymerase sigma-70 factor (ECF subfamily)
MNTATSGGLWEKDTDWALLQLAHAAIPDSSRDAWKRLFMQYDEPVRRFLRHLVRNDDASDELYQEFWLRFLRGDFAGARPERGRFRNLLRTAMSNLVVDYFRRRKRRGEIALVELPDAEPDLLTQLADEHVQFWRRELIHRTHAALEAECEKSGDPHAAVLKIEMENRPQTSAEKSAILSRVLSRAVRADNYRQMFRRARVRFADLLIQEVSKSLTNPTAELIREEMTELRLAKYMDHSNVSPGTAAKPSASAMSRTILPKSR